MNQGLNFPAFIKGGAYPVRDIGGNKRLFDRWGLGVEPHEDGYFFGTHLWRRQQLLNLSDDFLAHLCQIPAEENGRFTNKPFCQRHLFAYPLLVVGNDPVGQD